MAFRAGFPTQVAKHAVVITGAGIVTPMGIGWEENSQGFRSGRSAFRPVSLFDTSRQRVGTAGELTVPARPPAEVETSNWRRMDRGTRMALIAASEALATADISGARMPMMVGTSAGAMELGEDYFKQAMSSPTRRAGQFMRAETYQPQRQMCWMAEALQVDGPIRIVSNACASGANAIGHAFHMVRSGRAERVLAGGFDALCQLVFCGFDSLQALSPTGIPRPFDADRDGLALGEGAGFMVIESLDSAKARGAKIRASLLGYGAATDVHHLTQPHPMGDAALATMQAACEMAKLEPEQIDYINAHGTGTPLNDVAEGEAIRRWAGEATKGIKVSSTKSAIGHLLGGAGAVESVICLLALQGQWLPPNLNVREPDPVCDFDLVRESRSACLRTAMTNSFGFGGANASIIFAREVAI